MRKGEEGNQGKHLEKPASGRGALGTCPTAFQWCTGFVVGTQYFRLRAETIGGSCPTAPMTAENNVWPSNSIQVSQLKETSLASYQSKRDTTPLNWMNPYGFTQSPTPGPFYEFFVARVRATNYNRYLITILRMIK